MTLKGSNLCENFIDTGGTGLRSPLMRNEMKNDMRNEKINNGKMTYIIAARGNLYRFLTDNKNETKHKSWHLNRSKTEKSFVKRHESES